jgi:hypothetical protein
MSPASTTIALLVLVGVVALLIRWFSRDQEVESSGTKPSPVDELLAEAQDLDADEVAEAAAMDSEGWSFVPDGDRVRLIPPPEDRMRHAGRPHDHVFVRGDLTGARVVRGAPGFDPWRLEALGRDLEYRAWFFETEDGARTAADLLERRVVVPPRNEDGDPQPPVDRDFDEARRRDEETEQALDQVE